ncbi:LexA family protein [Chitinophaga defluvii]|uniref:S24 family peptidase n=1 Tax=Chitinophaga defluvii TaxID=3163343 RepID=A0ABV2T5Z0_9BACT
MLRGIQGTYLYVCDEALRAYFAQYIPVYSTISLQRNGAKLVSLKGNYVPLYEPQVAAGEFSEQQIVTDSVELISVPEEIKISKDHFACKVVGESMNKVIPNGSICLFRKYNGGSRNGEIVLASHTKIQDVDFGPQFTIKQYFSEKTINDDTWHHSSIILRPLSHDPRYESIILEYDELSEFKIYGIFERIL